MAMKNIGGPNREGVNPGDARGILFNNTGAAVIRGKVGELDFTTASSSTGWMPTTVKAVADILTGVCCVAEESIANDSTKSGYWKICGIADVEVMATAAAGDDLSMVAADVGLDPTPGATAKIVGRALEAITIDTVGKVMLDGWNGFGNVA